MERQLIQATLLSIIFKTPNLLHMPSWSSAIGSLRLLVFLVSAEISEHCDTYAKMTIQKTVLTITDYYTGSLLKTQNHFQNSQHVLEA